MTSSLQFTEQNILGKDPTVETSFLPDRYGIDLYIKILSKRNIMFYFLVGLKNCAGRKNDLSGREKQRNKQNGKYYGGSGYASKN